MPLYEVEVQRSSTVYVQVEAVNEADARAHWSRGVQLNEFIEHEEVENVIAYDDRFDDDGPLEDEDYADEGDDAYDG